MSHVVTTLVFFLILYSWVGAGLCSSLPAFKKMSKITFGDLDSGKYRNIMVNNFLIFLRWISNLIHKFYICNFQSTGLSRHLGWFLLFIFALEGVFGMIPAIYMDGEYMACKYIILIQYKRIGPFALFVYQPIYIK